MKFVVTGDFVNSASFTETSRGQIERLLSAFSSTSKSQFEYFIRGDGIQFLAQGNPLIEALELKSRLHAEVNVRLRLAIGMGDIGKLQKRLSNSVGSAFIRSGQLLDSMKPKNQLIAIELENKNLNSEWEVHCKVLDYLEMQRTQSQSEVIVGLLQNKTQKQIAEEIGISQPSVNQRIRSSGWELVEAIINRFEVQIYSKAI